jgi:ATP-dependent Clp protease protease subunit
MRPCYTFIAASDNKPPTLSIFEDIGFWGVQAKDFLASLAAVEGPVLTVEISSPGGDAFAAVAMYNGLRASGKEITTKVMGVAASAASLIFMAGDKRVMPKNTHLMVHNPSAFGGGTADDHQEMADMLSKVGATIRGTYAARSGMSDEDVATLLSKDTWLTADEALANGLATEVVGEVKATVSFDMDRADLPESVRAVYMAAKPTQQAPTEPVTGDQATSAFADTALAAMTSAGLQEHAPQWVLAHTTMSEIEARIVTAKAITSLCAVTGTASHADALIKANKSVVEARAALVEMQAKADEDTHVDTTPRVNNQQPTRTTAKPKVSTASLWASHNAQNAKQ